MATLPDGWSVTVTYVSEPGDDAFPAYWEIRISDVGEHVTDAIRDPDGGWRKVEGGEPAYDEATEKWGIVNAHTVRVTERTLRLDPVVPDVVVDWLLERGLL